MLALLLRVPDDPQLREQRQRVSHGRSATPTAWSSLEQHLHIFVEQPIQEAFLLSARWFIKVLNVYYGTLHFVITAGLLIWVYHCRHAAYRRMRNLLGMTTALALIGYWAFPLAPPRLLPWHGFVDTLDTIGGLWSYNSPVAKAVANPFAAMPSLHFGWALWCGMVLLDVDHGTGSRARWRVIYPFLTLTGHRRHGQPLLPRRRRWRRHLLHRAGHPERLGALRRPPARAGVEQTAPTASQPPRDAAAEELGGVPTG